MATGGDEMTYQTDFFPPEVAPRIAERIAYHEAGHAVALVLDGGEVERVVLHHHAKPGGHVYGKGWTGRAVLAGMAAERIAFPTTPHPGAIDPELRGFCGWRPDLSRFRRMQREGKAGALRSELDEAERILREHWSAVEALSHALADLGEVHGSEVLR
jgi:hypothetical protein